MSERSPEQINAQAAAWLARREAPDWSDLDHAQLQSWLQASFRNRVAYLRLEAVWKKAARLKALGAGYAPGEIPPPGEWRRSPFAESADLPKAEQRRVASRRRLLFTLAASVLLPLLAGVVWYLAPHGSRYQTAIGAVETVAITDGSRVTLNTDSEIRVSLSEKERHIQLDRGEVFFEVAKDPRRPFVVHSGPTSVTAVGTQFSVRRRGPDTFVVVTEGVVRIENGASPSVPQPQTVKAGQVARVSDAGVLIQEEPVPRQEDQLSWRTGLLVFRDTRLEDAVAEFNRYNLRQIVIADPELRNLHVAGSFKATSTEAFVHLLEQGFPLRAEAHDNALILLPQ